MAIGALAVARRGLSDAEHVDRRLAQRARPLRRRDDERDRTVGDQAAVVEVERLGDVAGGLVVLQRERLADLGLLVLHRPLPLRHGDRPELLTRGAVHAHVPLGRHGVAGVGAVEAVGVEDAAHPVRTLPGAV